MNKFKCPHDAHEKTIKVMKNNKETDIIWQKEYVISDEIKQKLTMVVCARCGTPHIFSEELPV